MKKVLGVLPNDIYNQTLVANVHPSDWINPESTGRYNLVVIGAGTLLGLFALIPALYTKIKKRKENIT